ncbi:MAG: LysR family transcriptional regulator [Oceanicoccus sp.]
MISHRQLIHALTLYKHGNFTRAAEESNISQSAFSRSIRNLEESLGVPLFDRDTNCVIPTRYGVALLHKAKAIVADTVELQREIYLMQGLEVGGLTVALGVYPAEVSGNRALGYMLRKHPRLSYRAFAGNWETVNQQVLSREVDLGFATIETAEIDDRLTVERVNQSEMFLYCRKGHPLADRKDVSREDLDQFPLVSIRAPSALADAIPGKAEIDPSSGHLIPTMEIDDFTTARTVISNSDGVGVAIPTQIQTQLISGEFTLLKYQRPMVTPVFGFILLKNRTLSPAAEVFMEHVATLEKDASRTNGVLIEKYFG